MPRTIQVTVVYSVHIEDDKMSEKKAFEYAMENVSTEGKEFHSEAALLDQWVDAKIKPRKGIGSY